MPNAAWLQVLERGHVTMYYYGTTGKMVTYGTKTRAELPERWWLCIRPGEEAAKIVSYAFGINPNAFFRQHAPKYFSAVELETVLNGHPDIFESAAVSVAPKGGGPERLVVFVVSERKANDPETLKKELQTILNERLNPLFRISEVRLCNHLPRTASNKVMRKELRKEIESR